MFLSLNNTSSSMSPSSLTWTAPICKPISSFNSSYGRWGLRGMGSNKSPARVREGIRLLLQWLMITNNSNWVAGLLLLTWWLVVLAFTLDNDCPQCWCQATWLAWSEQWYSVGCIQSEFGQILVGLADRQTDRIYDISDHQMIYDIIIFYRGKYPVMTSKRTIYYRK